MTLNTFHFAGTYCLIFDFSIVDIFQGHGAANVTLGIPRLREIVMTASQKPKTPSMTMKVRPDITAEDITMFCKRASRVTLAQIVENVEVKEQLRVEGETRRTQFTIEIKFFPKVEYQAEYDVEPSEILAVFATKFPLTLKREMQNEMKKLDADLKSQIAELGKGKKTKSRQGDDENDGDDNEEAPTKRKDDDEESEAGDGGADDEKRARQKKQQATYESDDSDVEDAEAFNDEDIEAAYAPEAEAMEFDAKSAKKGRAQPLKMLINRTSDLFQGHLPHATSFEFDESRCVFQLEVSDICRDYVVWPDRCLLSSSGLTCQNCCLLALLSERVGRQSSAKFQGLQNVSKRRMKRKGTSRYVVQVFFGLPPAKWTERTAHHQRVQPPWDVGVCCELR